MLRRTAIRNICFIALTVFSTAGFAHNKVVVIPLGGEEAPTSKTIFWTDESYNGDLGGITGADDKCQMSAVNAGVRGVFKAWLGVQGNFDSTPHRPDFTYYDLPYHNVDGTEVAAGFAEILVSDYPNDTKSGTSQQSTVTMWTGLESDGSLQGPNCSEWGNSNLLFSGYRRTFCPTGTLCLGPSTSSCDVFHHLLCFEQ